jgi:hypothetical protein
VTEKLPPDEVDADFRALTLSLSTPLPRPLEPEDKVPVEKWVVEVPIGVSDWGENDPRYPGRPTAAGRRKPRYSGSLFPKKQPPVT